ncbi:flagellar basal body P-ring formation protein FlgA [Ideonella sp. TBM-1]|uniref:Flagella basal body P-ring formation protein FlgA n=1 Tax=Ideonella livida TaxID=2707176 RepID=A0A7C9PK94_9BURK|nr:flagellar basal body P-ring formation protein FlgA [Ideonella livida]
MARERALAVAPEARVEVQVGRLDPAWRLAPCSRVAAFAPPGVPAAGRTRVGLRCEQGPKAWKVTVPVAVALWQAAPVLRQALPAGTTLEAAHLMEAEVDLGSGREPPWPAARLLGRQLQRPLEAGEAVRPADLRARQWFAAGEVVQVVAEGEGWRITTAGQALSPGLEGQWARVRTEGGRVLTGQPVGERLMRVAP